MVRIWKDSWAPGTWTLLSGDSVTYTAGEIKAGVARLKALVKAGWYVPLVEAHDVNNQPRAVAQLAEDLRTRRLGTIGRVRDARQRQDGVAEFLVEVPPGNVGLLREKPFVSPQIHKDWDAGGNRILPGLTCTHLSLAHSPIWSVGQRPFQLSADAPRGYRHPRVAQLGNGDTLRSSTVNDEELQTLMAALKRHNINLPEERIKSFEDLLLALDTLAGEPAENGEEALPPISMSADPDTRAIEREAIADADSYLARRSAGARWRQQQGRRGA